jgi:putative nucleotidyltransferase with HDIG domain
MEISLQRQVENLLEKYSFSPKQISSIEKSLTDLYGWHAPTYEHSVNVALNAERAAGYLGFPRKIAVSIGLMHDVGKLGTPKEILNSSSLTEKQRKVINEHPVIGYEMLKSMADSIEDQIILESELLIHGFQENYYPFDARNPNVLNRLGKEFSTKDAKTIYLGSAGVAVCDFIHAAANRKDDYFGPGNVPDACSRADVLLFLLKQYRPTTGWLANLFSRYNLLEHNGNGHNGNHNGNSYNGNHNGNNHHNNGHHGNGHSIGFHIL